MIMRDRVPCRAPLLGLLAIGVLALVCLPGWSQPEVQVQRLPVDKEVSGPDKRIIITAPSDVEWQAKPIIGVVQKTVGDKQVDVDVKGKPGSTSERDRRLDRLEAQLQELFKEVKALRGGDSKLQNKLPGETWKTSPPSKTVEPTDRPRVIRSGDKYVPSDTSAEAKSDRGVIRSPVYGKGTQSAPWFYDAEKKGTATNVVTLTRSTYKLPHATAEALASLLPQHKQEMEAQVDGDTLTITTTSPEAQRAIGEFIGFLQRSGAADRPPAKVR